MEHKRISLSGTPAMKQGRNYFHQLAIWPPDSQHEAQDFLWQLSLLDIHEEEYDLEVFPDYNRALMLISSDEATLTYGNGKSVFLDGFELDSVQLDGAQQVHAAGEDGWVALDFLVRKGHQIHLDILKTDNEDWQECGSTVQSKDGSQVHILYCHRGRTDVSLPMCSMISLESIDGLVLHYGPGETPEYRIFGNNFGSGTIRAQIYSDEKKGGLRGLFKRFENK